MLKKIYSLLLLVSTILILGGCSDSIEGPNSLTPYSPGTITISIISSESSRSTESDNPEIKIDNIVIGLYTNTSNEEAAAIVWKTYEDLDKSGEASFTMRLTDDIVKTLFYDGDDKLCNCSFFVIANVPNIDEIPEKAPISTLKQWLVESNFNDPQSSFIMAGEGEVEYTAPKENTKEVGSASGITSLSRAAAKIRLNVNIPNEITDSKGVKWISVTKNEETDESMIWVLLNNGVKKAVAAPWPTKTDDKTIPWAPNSVDAYYNTTLNEGACSLKLDDTAEGEGSADEDTNAADYPYVMDAPFYTYPNSWTESIEETHKTTLTLIVPWQKEGEDQYQTFYYQVPVTEADITEIVHNHSYTINLNVGMLGNTTPDTPLEVEGSYEVVKWGDEDIDVKIPDYRYLVVDPEYTFYNTDVLSIPFYTSHEVEISDITMSYQRFNYPGNYSGDEVDVEISNDVIKRSVHTYMADGKEITDTICNYSIVRDPVSKQLNIQIIHPMTMWVPLDKDGYPVSLTLQGAKDGINIPIKDTEKKIYRYAYPTQGKYYETFWDPLAWDPTADDGDGAYTGNYVTNAYKPEIAYFPYSFKVTLRHKDNYNFQKSVVVKQYPGMYIETDKNKGGSYISYNSDKYAPDRENEWKEWNYGYAFLNAKPMSVKDISGFQNADIAYEDKPDDKEEMKKPGEEGRSFAESAYMEYYKKGLGGIMPLEARNSGADKTVQNNNMYVITITQLESGIDDEYIIGDPRSKVVNNDLMGNIEESYEEEGDWSEGAPALYGNSNRKLKYYYPADESNSTKMMIAPKLRVSSAFGYVRTQSCIIDPGIGRRRAAAYQEQGFPAGRWRLPTYGEVKFIVNLSQKNKIPPLFKSGMIYLTANGAFRILDNGELEGPLDLKLEVIWSNVNKRWQISSSKSISANVRPVYDEWYWELQDNLVLQPGENGGYIYTFGDAPIKTN